jgi:hypothetical protein
MVHIPIEHSPCNRHNLWSHLESHIRIKLMLAEHRQRNHQPTKLRGTLAMTTCGCEHVSEPLVMSRQLLQDTIRQNRHLEKSLNIAQVITIIQDLKFQERTTDYDAGYDDALDQAIRSITKLTQEEIN